MNHFDLVYLRDELRHTFPSNERDMESLKDFYHKTENALRFVISQIKEEGEFLRYTYLLNDVEGNLSLWFKERKKAEISRFGRDIKSDLIEVVTGLITEGDKNNIWN